MIFVVRSPLSYSLTTHDIVNLRAVFTSMIHSQYNCPKLGYNISERMIHETIRFFIPPEMHSDKCSMNTAAIKMEA